MKKINVMSIFGTRPEAIKMAPLVLELAKRENVNSLCCVTAQHREMLDSVLEIFQLRPDYDLNIMKPGQTLSGITANALLGLETVIKEAQPDIVLVHGDTTTTGTEDIATEPSAESTSLKVVRVIITVLEVFASVVFSRVTKPSSERRFSVSV